MFYLLFSNDRCFVVVLATKDIHFYFYLLQKIYTSQLPVSSWYNYLNNDTVADAMAECPDVNRLAVRIVPAYANN